LAQSWALATIAACCPGDRCLHEACGLPVAAAFNAGNLEEVVRAVRKRHPSARILVCGDDDAGTLARTGTNPGRDAAHQAAAKVARAVCLMPAGLAEGGTDFNDLAASAGLEEVGHQVMAAIAAAEAPAADQNEPQGAPDGVEGLPAPADPPKRRGGTEAPAGGGGGDGRFSLRPDGVYFDGGKSDNSGSPLPPARICGPLEVLAESRDADSKGWGLLLRIANRDGQDREWLASGALLAKHGYLDTDPKDSRLAKKVRLPLIGATRCYAVKPSIFDLEG
jgi:putative DNA primase/helicase